MALPHVSLIFGRTGQVVDFYPPNAHVIDFGRPTSAATYAVYKAEVGDDDTAEFSGTATLDSVDTTVDVASGYSNTTSRARAYLTATTGIAYGRRYLLHNTAAGGAQRAIVTAKGIATGDYVRLDRDLAEDFAVNATFQGIRHYFTIDSTFIQDTSKINVYASLTSTLGDVEAPQKAPPYRIKFAYTTGDGIARVAWMTFDVARRPFQTGVNIDDLRRQLPDLAYHEWLEQRGDDFQPQIDQAESDVIFLVRMAKYDPNAITDPQVLGHLVTLKALEIILVALDSAKGVVSDTTRWFADKFQKAFAAAIGVGLSTWISTGTSGAVASNPPRQLMLRGR